MPDWSTETHGYVLGWACHHREVCSVPGCGKVFREPWELGDDECPAYPGTPEQRAVAEAQMAEYEDRRARLPWRRKPVITGPQGYRRGRSG
jgi:hypothetical protein